MGNEILSFGWCFEIPRFPFLLLVTVSVGIWEFIDFCKWCSWLLLILLVLSDGLVEGGNIVHDYEDAPNRPGCENNFVFVVFWDPGLVFSCEILVGVLSFLVLFLWLELKEGWRIEVFYFLFFMRLWIWSIIF